MRRSAPAIASPSSSSSAMPARARRRRIGIAERRCAHSRAPRPAGSAGGPAARRDAGDGDDAERRGGQHPSTPRAPGAQLAVAGSLTRTTCTGPVAAEAHREGGDEVAVDVTLGEHAVGAARRRSRRPCAGPSRRRASAGGSVQRDGVVGRWRRLESSAERRPVPLDGMPAGDDRRLPLQLEQFTALDVAADGERRRARRRRAPRAAATPRSSRGSRRLTRTPRIDRGAVEAVPDAADRRDAAGPPGRSPSLRRMRLMCTSSVFVEPHQFSSHTSSISCSRVTTAPASRASRSSTSNSFGRSASSSSPTRTRRAARSIVTSPTTVRARGVGRSAAARGRDEAQVGCDAGQQLGETERLDDVVDGPQLEAGTTSTSSLRAVTTMTGTWGWSPGQHRADLLAVTVGQAEVEQHQVGHGAVEAPEGGGHRGGRLTS